MKKMWKKNKEEAVPAVKEDGDLEIVSLSDKKLPEKKKEKRTLTPAQKKKRRKRIIMGVIAACLVLFVASRFLMPAPLPMVSVRSAEIGNIEQTVDTSGTVKTEQMKTYFSPLTAKVSECRVSVGDAVSAGDVLVVYDAADLENRKKEASLQNDEAYYSYQDTVGKSNADAAEYSRSSHDVEILEQQVAACKGDVEALQQYIADLNCHLTDAQKDDHQTTAARLQNQITQASNDLTKKQSELADYESDLAEQKGIQSSTKSSVLTASGKKQAEATKELAALKAEEVSAAADQVADGLKAEFGGVVTDVKAVDGSQVEASGELLTIESNEDVCVEISLSKSDLEKVKEGQKATITVVGKDYEGTVTRISKSATKNDKGAAVVAGEIHINNPDADIFLGVEAKVSIEGQKAENVVMAPIEAVNIGKDGSFVYIVNNGVVEKREVETGISSAEYVEIKSGLDGTEQIVLSSAGVTEGAQVTPVED